MKINFLIIFAFLFITLSLKRNENVEGEYYDYFGSTLQINSDSTFLYTWRFDMGSSWTMGKWKFNHHIVNFEIIPIYDTIRIARRKDVMILSYDQKVDIFTEDTNVVSNFITSGGQNRQPMVSRLYYKDDKLLRIDDEGRLVTKKVNGFWTNENYNTWFVKKNK